jgi:hypothetical protein
MSIWPRLAGGLSSLDHYCFLPAPNIKVYSTAINNSVSIVAKLRPSMMVKAIDQGGSVGDHFILLINSYIFLAIASREAYFPGIA